MNQVQVFVRDYVSNPELRRLAAADPAAALGGYRLTDAERASLTRLCQRADGVASENGPTAYWT